MLLSVSIFLSTLCIMGYYERFPICIFVILFFNNIENYCFQFQICYEFLLITEMDIEVAMRVRPCDLSSAIIVRASQAGYKTVEELDDDDKRGKLKSTCQMNLKEKQKYVNDNLFSVDIYIVPFFCSRGLGVPGCCEHTVTLQIRD